MCGGGSKCKAAWPIALAYLKVSPSLDIQVRASKELWQKETWESLSLLKQQRALHTCGSRAYQCFRTPPCTLLGRIPTLVLHRLGVVHAGAKLDTRGHRSATDFALGPFLVYNFQQQQRPGNPGPSETEHLLPKKLADTSPWWNGWNQKMSPTACVYPCFHHGANVTVLHNGGWSTI